MDREQFIFCSDYFSEKDRTVERALFLKRNAPKLLRLRKKVVTKEGEQYGIFQKENRSEDL